MLCCRCLQENNKEMEDIECQCSYKKKINTKHFIRKLLRLVSRWLNEIAFYVYEE